MYEALMSRALSIVHGARGRISPDTVGFDPEFSTQFFAEVIRVRYTASHSARAPRSVRHVPLRWLFLYTRT